MESEFDYRQLRMGELLVKAGAMTNKQVHEVLQRQKETNKPFGMIAQKMFGIPAKSVWQAYARQMAVAIEETVLILEPRNIEAMTYIPLKDSYRYHMLPLRYEPQTGVLVCATSKAKFAEALQYYHSCLRHLVIEFVFVDHREIEDDIQQVSDTLKRYKELKKNVAEQKRETEMAMN